MKRLLAVGLVLISAVILFQTNASKPSKKTMVEVFYFHFTHRCVTCQAVESETLKSLPALYPHLYKTGKITFTSVNLDEDTSKTLAEKCKAEGQSLLIISNNKRIDLTDKAFMYAKNDPDKLKAEIKKTIDSLIK